MTYDEFRETVIHGHGSIVEAAFQGEQPPDDAPDDVVDAWNALADALHGMERYIEPWLRFP